MSRKTQRGMRWATVSTRYRSPDGEWRLGSFDLRLRMATSIEIATACEEACQQACAVGLEAASSAILITIMRPFVIGWRGVFSDEGIDVPFTPERFESLCARGHLEAIWQAFERTLGPQVQAELQRLMARAKLSIATSLGRIVTRQNVPTAGCVFPTATPTLH